jgi:hypothetical protein
VTPKEYKNRYGDRLSLECYEGNHDECTDTYETCACTYRGLHKTMHAYLNAPIPGSAPSVETPTKEAYEGMAQGNASPEPPDTTGRPESTGFEVLVKIHTKDADQKLHSPELLRFLVGKVIDSRYRLEEEIDYTLEVKRVYR